MRGQFESEENEFLLLHRSHVQFTIQIDGDDNQSAGDRRVGTATEGHQHIGRGNDLLWHCIRCQRTVCRRVFLQEQEKRTIQRDPNGKWGANSSIDF